MSGLDLIERFRIPDYGDPEQIEHGRVTIDPDKCKGCGLCVKACPADALELDGNKGRVKSMGICECMLCGDCLAICPEKAVSLVRSFRYRGYFKTIDRGEIQPPRYSV